MESSPSRVFNVIEFLTKKTLSYIVKPEKTKLTRVHKDLHLNNVQKVLSATMFEFFYENYVKASEVKL